jgi:HPt (histidine-containing phosphotransfer) domain-containing protein
MDSMLDVGDLSFDEDELITEEVPVQTQIVKENFDNGYIYDPHVASDELGLPLDLIEEFIQDFILQAKEFKDDLYKSLNNAELDNVKILSHKLKGVAANLRVEDAFETLSIINNSADVNVIRENMDTFYKIVAKLAGEEIEVEKTVTVEVHPEITPDEPLDIKIEETAEKKEVESLEDEDLEDDLYSIDDAEVPQKIEIPELADDDFLSNDLEIEEIDHELDNIEDIELLELDKELDSSEEDLEDLEFKEEPQAIEYSKKTAASEIGIDQESFNELLDDYLIEGQTITREMLTSLSDDDFAALKNEAMKLKGMSENMRITNFLPELKVIMSSNDTAEITKAIEKINAILAQISKIGE